MQTDHASSPRVMVSSTGTDLKEHRDVMRMVIDGRQLHAYGMDNNSESLTEDLIASSVNMVGKVAAYVLIIGRRYGQTFKCNRNPNGLSLTELEFDEACRLQLPMLVFLMGSDHKIPESSFESDPDKRRQLEAFRNKARKSGADSTVDRVCHEFDDILDFERQAAISVSELRNHLNSSGTLRMPRSRRPRLFKCQRNWPVSLMLSRPNWAIIY